MTAKMQDMSPNGLVDGSQQAKSSRIGHVPSEKPSVDISRHSTTQYIRDFGEPTR